MIEITNDVDKFDVEDEMDAPTDFDSSVFTFDPYVA